ncbi:hypothetical protein VTN77DRAFT_9833 [Rasamsonia byssochlamydoides]|uniref:uncharacterized protein n=1 Tax=Rasamsonia byssochlamydoides TaxID=89139 RepID=UPI0037428FBA
MLSSAEDCVPEHKMIISSRQSPPKTALRRAFSANTLGLKQLSKNGLLAPLVDSPLPSPALPSILPRHGKKSTTSRRRRAIRLLVWLASAVCLLKLIQCFSDPAIIKNQVGYWSGDGKIYQLAGTDILPAHATPIVITDQKGRQKWTISIPPGTKSPLSPSEYADLCSQCVEISQRLSHNKTQAFGYYRRDQNFMDVADAEDIGLLPRSSSVQQATLDNGHNKVCETSLTFVMQSEDAGLGKTLMALWMSYGLAQKEGRSFFIDDTDWAYGRYSTYFKPPPKPSCLPPMPSQKVPCPLQARHLVVSSANAPWIFGDSFREHFEDSRKSGVQRQKPIFDFLRSGYEALFDLAADDAAYLTKRTGELDDIVHKKGGIEIGVHVRRGDLHPLEFQYQESYIPLERYAEAARKVLQDPPLKSNSHADLSDRVAHSKIILASDDPDIYSASELIGFEKAQAYISLASKSVLDALAASQEGHGGQKPVDENIGWEGGFFKDMFWSLGAPPTIPAAGSPLPSKRQPPVPGTAAAVASPLHRFQSPEEALKIRELIGRAYLLDLAVLGQTDKVICGISSVSCRLLAVMMGWDRAILDKGWQNIDGNWHWRDVVYSSSEFY